MSKRLVMCTSTGCIDYGPEEYRKLPIEKIRVKVLFNDKEYQEGEDLDPVWFYNQLETIEDPKNHLPRTAMPSVEEIGTKFEEAISNGYDEIIVIALSSGLGGTYNLISLVAKDYQDRIKITVIDSKIACFNEGLLAIKAYEMVEKGLPTEEVVREINWMMKHQQLLGVAVRLDYLIYNGRLKGGKAFMGKMMHICPVIHFDGDGVLTSMATVRTSKKAMEKTVELLKNYLGNRKSEDYILGHVFTGPSTLPMLKEAEAKEGIVCNNPDVIMSTVSGCHTGPWVAGYYVLFLRRDDEPLDE